MKHFSTDQRGIGHVLAILVLVVIVGLAGVGWLVIQKNKNKATTNTAAPALAEAVKNAKCGYDDKDLCKFFTSWKAQKYYTLTSINESDGQKSTTVMKADGKKYSMKVTGGTPYETITIDDALYTKAADGTWWKQIIPKADADKYTDAGTKLEEPTAAQATADTTAYKKLGKEKCGSFTCFKYQVIDPTDTGLTSYMWFDDDQYQLRRMQNTSASVTYDATYSYGKVSVSAPSPSKNLGPNQYLIPGQAEPITLPNPEDYQNMLP